MKHKFQLINLKVRIKKLDRFLLFLKNIKGIKRERGCEEQHTVRFTESGGEIVSELAWF